MRYITYTMFVTILGAFAPVHSQQPGPFAAIEVTGNSVSDSVFPLWKSLLEGRQFMPPYGVNMVLMDLSGQWDVQKFSAAVGNNEIASISGSAHVHPFTYGARADVWILPFLNVFATGGGLKLNVQATGLDLPLGVSSRPPEVIRGDVNIDLNFTGYYGGGGLGLIIVIILILVLLGRI